MTLFCSLMPSFRTAQAAFCNYERSTDCRDLNDVSVLSPVSLLQLL